MATYRRKAFVFDAVQWHKEGDSPLVVGVPPEQQRPYPGECVRNCGHGTMAHGIIPDVTDAEMHFVCPGDFILVSRYNDDPYAGKITRCSEAEFKHDYEDDEPLRLRVQQISKRMWANINAYTQRRATTFIRNWTKAAKVRLSDEATKMLHAKLVKAFKRDEKWARIVLPPEGDDVH